MKFTKTVKRILVSVFSALFCVALGLFFSVGSVFTAKAAETVTTTTTVPTTTTTVKQDGPKDEAKPDTPKTADVSESMLYMLVAGLAVVAVVMTSTVLKKAAR